LWFARPGQIHHRLRLAALARSKENRYHVFSAAQKYLSHFAQFWEEGEEDGRNRFVMVFNQSFYFASTLHCS
jgi:hypothetical protein